MYYKEKKENKNKLKESDVKYCTCYYFDDIIKTEDFDKILIDEKSYENMVVYNILYEILIDSNPLRVRFNKIEGFIRVYNRTRYLKLFGSQKYFSIYNRIRDIS